MKKTILLVCILLLLCNIAYAAKWEQALIDLKGNTFYVDVSDINYSKQKITFWTKQENVDPFKNNGAKTLIWKSVVDLKNYKCRIFNGTTYYEDGTVKTIPLGNEYDIQFTSNISYILGKAIVSCMNKQAWTQVNDSSFSNQYKDLDGTIIYLEKSYLENGDVSYGLISFNPNNRIMNIYTVGSYNSKDQNYYSVFLGNPAINPPLKKGVPSDIVVEEVMKNLPPDN